MKGLLVFVAICGCALARPDIGLKIRQGQYPQPPSTNYGIPTGSYLPAAPSNIFSSPDFAQVQQTSVTTTGNTHYNAPTEHVEYHQTQQTQQTHSAPTTYQSTNYQETPQTHQQTYQSTFTNYQEAPQTHQQTYQQTYQQNQYQNQYQTQEAQVHKHVYFYDAPQDLPGPTIRINGGVGAAQKNYKIIFIKAPGYQAPQVPQIPAGAQNEEKTLVYVLVKHPDAAQDIVLPTLAPSKPSKPEVFFIKYKTQKEAEHQIHQIQQGATAGEGARHVESDASFINTITDTKVADNGHGHGNVFTTGNIVTSDSGNSGINDVFHDVGASNVHVETKTTSTNFGPAGSSGPY